MTQLLAIEWDSREARLAVATPARGSVRVDELFAVDLVAADGESELPAAEVAERIAAAIRQRKLAGVETLVAVARASIELKPLSLPPAPDDEVPGLARFQALRDFNTLGDDWPLDFIPLSGNETEPRTVLAAAIAPQAIRNSHVPVGRTRRQAHRPSPCRGVAAQRRPAERRIRLLVDAQRRSGSTVLVGTPSYSPARPACRTDSSR
jgi:hypothetical protein